MKCIYCENNNRCKIQEIFTQEEIGCSKGVLNYSDEKKLDAFNVAKKVFKCNSLYEHHIYSAYESGWITKEEYELLEEVLNKK